MILLAVFLTACGGGGGNGNGGGEVPIEGGNGNGGGGNGGNGGNGNGGGEVPIEGLLSGDPDSWASEAVYDYDGDDVVRDDEISITADGASIARTKLEIAFFGDATVGDINALLQSINGRITSMLEGVNLIVVRIPDPDSLDALDSIIAQLEANTKILFVNRAHMLGYSGLPDNYDAATSDLTKIDHHLAVRAHAAWNARAALNNVSSSDIPLLIVVDRFGSGPPNSDFDVNSISADFSASDPDTHGYGVLSVISAKFGGSATDRGLATGIYPGTLDLRVVDLKKGYDVPTIEDKLIQLIKGAGKNVVVNTSLGVTCGVPPMTTCVEKRARAWLLRVRGWSLYGTGMTDDILSLENNFMHFSAAGNFSQIGSVFAWKASGWNAARLRNDLKNYNDLTLEKLTNTLVIENRQNSMNQPYEGGCIHPDSMYPGDLSAIGTDVWMLAGSSSGAVNASGTSFASPQAAGLAAYVWALKPSLKPEELLQLLTKTAIDYDPGCASIPRSPKPVIDAYNAVLAVDDASALSSGPPSKAPVRLAILDVVDALGNPGGNGIFDEIDVERFLYEMTYDLDYSRYDLNGDGYTGGDHATKFNLDIDYFPTYGDVTQEIKGTTVHFNENKVTDLDVLCYYAYSPLYTGDETNRDTLLAHKCGQCKIAFARTPTDTLILNIYEMDDDGSNQINITSWSDDFSSLWGLAWSPDGGELAFSGDESIGDYYDIYILDTDGIVQKHLTEPDTDDEVHPAWSPDGSKIAFTDFSEIYVMSTLGIGRSQIPHGSGYTGYTPEHPTWSPDGTKLAFADWKDGSANVFVHDFTTGVNSDLGFGWSPAWSPDGHEIAFTAGSNLHELHVMNPDGSGRTKLHGFLNSDDQIIRTITWSPDSKKIAFDVQHYDPSQFDIYVINADGSGFQNITNTTGVYEQFPAWAP